MDILQTLVSAFTDYGYLAVFLVLLFCGFGLPIPEDVTLVAGGIISGLGYTNVHIMFAVSLAGVLIGDSIMFLLGYHYGQQVLRWRWVSYMMTPKRYRMVQDKFDRYGRYVLFIARFLPGLRCPIFLFAGLSHRVSLWRFLLCDSAAALLSVPIWVYLGHYGAYNHDWLIRWIKRGGQTTLLIVLALLVAVAIACYLRRRRRR